MSSDPLEDLYLRPGFMLRRANQIAVSVFLEETSELGITPTQYGILYLLMHRPNIDQISVARLIGLDRSTTGMVVNSLENAGLLHRLVDESDKRRRSLELTPSGRALLKRLETPAARAVKRLLSPLTPSERTTFMKILEKLVSAYDANSRVPLIRGAAEKEVQNGQITRRRSR